MGGHEQLPNLLGLVISQNSQGFCRFQGPFLIERHSGTLRSNLPDAESPYNARIAEYGVVCSCSRKLCLH